MTSGHTVEGFAHYYHEDFANAKVNSGLYYGTTKRFDIAPAGQHELLVEVNANYCHGVLAFSGNNTMLIDIFYGPTASDNGTPVVSHNFKTYVPNIATTQLYDAPTITTDGVRLIEHVIFGSGGRNAIGASTSNLRKFILAPNTKYLIRFTSIDPGGTPPPTGYYMGFIQFNFYETDFP